jgi:hypothetical protein
VPQAANNKDVQTSDESADNIRAAGSENNEHQGKQTVEGLEANSDTVQDAESNALTDEDEPSKKRKHVDAEFLDHQEGNGVRGVEFVSSNDVFHFEFQNLMKKLS